MSNVWAKILGSTATEERRNTPDPSICLYPRVEAAVPVLKTAAGYVTPVNLQMNSITAQRAAKIDPAMKDRMLSSILARRRLNTATQYANRNPKRMYNTPVTLCAVNSSGVVERSSSVLDGICSAPFRMTGITRDTAVETRKAASQPRAVRSERGQSTLAVRIQSKTNRAMRKVPRYIEICTAEASSPVPIFATPVAVNGRKKTVTA